MVEIKLKLSNLLADKLKSCGDWLPMVIELCMARYKVLAVYIANSQLIQFLMSNPSTQEVLNYQLSDEELKRINYLVKLNPKSMTIEKQKELREWERLKDACILLKANADKMRNKS